MVIAHAHHTFTLHGFFALSSCIKIQALLATKPSLNLPLKRHMQMNSVCFAHQWAMTHSTQDSDVSHTHCMLTQRQTQTYGHTDAPHVWNTKRGNRKMMEGSTEQHYTDKEREDWVGAACVEFPSIIVKVMWLWAVWILCHYIHNARCLS